MKMSQIPLHNCYINGYNRVNAMNIIDGSGVCYMEKKEKVRSQNVNIKGGIGFRLMSMFILLILVPLLVMGYTMHNKSRAILKENLEASSNQLVLQTETSIQNFLQRFEDVVRLLASNSNFQNVNTGVAASEVTGEGEAAEPFERITAVGYDNVFLERYRNDTYKMAMWEQLTDMTDVNSDVLWAYMGTNDGIMFMRPNGDLPDGYDPRIRPWYKDAVAANDLVWTAPYADSTTLEMCITAAIPVQDANGGMAGVVGIDVSMQTMSEKLNEIQIGENGYAFLIDQNNGIMTNRDANLIGVNLDPAQNEIEGDILASFEKNADAFGKILAGIKSNADTVKLADGNYAVLHKIDAFGWTMVGVINESEFEKDANEILQFLVTIGVFTLLIAIAISFVFSKSLTSRIRRLLEAMEKVKEGDLTTVVDIRTKDEIGRLGNYFIDTLDQLSGLIRNIQEISYGVTESAQNLAATSEEASASADEVARTVEEIAKGASDQAQDAESSVIVAQSLSDKFNHLNERTVGMISSAEEVVIANTHGSDAISALKDKTKQTDEANENIEKVIVELDNNTQSIDAILDTISAIAVQTNLLALNASIEAARAGEHGRGFAVVAEEIRKLAEESSGAADKIRDIVTTIMTDSAKTVESMNVVRGFAQEQTEAVNNVDVSFDIISKSISAIVSEIQTIKESVEELIGDKDSIVGAISNISAVSEETAAASEEVSASMDQQTLAVEEVAKAAERMNEISVKLNQELSKFKV